MKNDEGAPAQSLLHPSAAFQIGYDSRRTSAFSFSGASSDRRISDSSSRRSSYASDLADYSHLHEYTPLHSVEPGHLDIIDLEVEEDSDVSSTTLYKPSTRQQSCFVKTCTILFPNTKRSFLRLLSLRTAFTIFSIFQMIMTFFSIEFLIVVFSDANFNYESIEAIPSTTAIDLQQYVIWIEVFQNHIHTFFPTDPIITFHRNSTFLVFRTCFSCMTCICALSMLRRYNDGFAFLTAFLLGWELAISVIILIARIPNAIRIDWDTSSHLVMYIISSIICVLYSWSFLVIQLCYWTQEQRVSVYLARQFPYSYGPSYYSLQSLAEEKIPFVPEEADTTASKRSSTSSRASALPERRIRVVRRSLLPEEGSKVGGSTTTTDDLENIEVKETQ